MQIRKLTAMAVAAALLLVTTIVNATLLGIQPNTGLIVQVDPNTGNTLGGFAPPGGALMPSQQFGGLSFAEGGATLIYQNPVSNPTDLFRINPSTGALLSTEFMPPAGSPAFRAGLSFETGAGIGGVDAIYAVNDGSPVQRQDGYNNPVLVNHTGGGVTFAGALGGDDNGRHFVVIGAAIIEFDPFNAGSILNTIPSPVSTNVAGMAFDGTDLFLSDLGGQLFTLNPDTGAVLNAVTVQDGPLIGLAAAVLVPEPTTLLLLGLGLAGLGFARKRLH